MIQADPTPAWIAIPDLLAVALTALARAAVTARQTEINYGE